MLSQEERKEKIEAIANNPAEALEMLENWSDAQIETEYFRFLDLDALGDKDE